MRVVARECGVRCVLLQLWMSSGSPCRESFSTLSAGLPMLRRIRRPSSGMRPESCGTSERTWREQVLVQGEGSEMRMPS